MKTDKLKTTRERERLFKVRCLLHIEKCEAENAERKDGAECELDGYAARHEERAREVVQQSLHAIDWRTPDG